MEGAEAYRYLRRDRQRPKPADLEGWAAAYVALRKAFGFTTRTTEGNLKHLIRFMHIRGLTSFGQIDRAAARAWLHSGSVQERTVCGRLMAAQGFFRYLLSLGAVEENVWGAFSIPKPKRFIPYIYSLDELRLILNTILGRVGRCRPGRPRVHFGHYVMTHTLYACGLRAREVCRLTIGDVDFERSLFLIRKTKFGKTRLVPFNARTGELIEQYLSRHRLRDDGMAPEAPLFLSLRRRAYAPCAVTEYFKHASAAAGVAKRKETKGNTVYGSTSPHALRHTFAVHRLLKWYQEGVDVNTKLPLLATYMGHSDYKHTQVYLTVLPRFIDIAGRLFAGKFETPLQELE